MLQKKASRIKSVLKAIVFIMLLLAVLHSVSYLVMPKAEVRLSNTRSQESMRVFDEPDNSLDVLFFGHSGVYSAISPMELYKEYGFTSYVCSQPAQLPWESAQWLRALLKVQTPKLVVFEVDHLFYDKSTTVIGNSFKHLVNSAFPVLKIIQAGRTGSRADRSVSAVRTRAFIITRPCVRIRERKSLRKRRKYIRSGKSIWTHWNRCIKCAKKTGLR